MQSLPETEEQYVTFIALQDGVRGLVKQNWDLIPKAERSAKYEAIVQQLLARFVSDCEASVTAELDQFERLELGAAASGRDLVLASLNNEVARIRTQTDRAGSIDREQFSNEFRQVEKLLKELRPKGAARSPAFGRFREASRSLVRKKTIQSAMSRYFSGGPALKPLQLLALLRVLGISDQAVADAHRGAPSIDLSRSAWRHPATTVRSAALTSSAWPNGEIYRLAPSASSRRLDGYLRKLRGPLDQRYYVSAGQSVMYVASGELTVTFLGAQPVELARGDALIYEGAHPHMMSVSGGSAEVIDIGVNVEGVGRQWHFGDFGDAIENLGEPEPSLEWVKKLRVAVALQSSRMSVEDIVSSSRLKETAVLDLWNARRSATDEEIHEVCFVTRRSPHELVHPLDVSAVGEDVFKVLKAEQIEQGDATVPSTGASHPEYQSGAWRNREVYRLAPGRAPSLAVGHLFVGGPAQHGEMHDHEGDEEMLIVLKGKLGFVVEDSRGQTKQGLFGPGDCVWFRSGLRHTLFAPEGPVQALQLCALGAPASSQPAGSPSTPGR